MNISLDRRALLALAACMALPSWAKTAAVFVAPLPLTQRTLANGLQVITIPDRSSATASVQVWVRAGGKDDPPGRSGFAHLFEHMMFKSTKHMANEMFDRLTEDVGGQNNAFTAEDTTAYHSVVPSNHLERILWAEAERMANLNVDEANFKSERAVVEEEYRQRVLADPYGRLFNALSEQAFEVHPYKRPVIGSVEDLQAATLADVRAFHATFYRPDNAVLIVAGDFDLPQLERWIDRYFGALAKPTTPIPRVTAQEPPRRAHKRVALTGPNVPLPAVALIWKGPPAKSADAPALQVASALLAAGESSRLNESLVYRQQIAQSAGISTDLYADAGLITAYAIGASGHAPPKLEQALLREIERLAQQPIGVAELDKVRARLVTSALAQRQTPLGKAMAVGWAVVLRGDPQAANREIAELQAVNAADVQRVLKRHLLAAKRVTIQYTQEGKRA
jgi:zinc protease